MSEPVWIAKTGSFSIGLVEDADPLRCFAVVVSLEGGQRILSADEVAEMSSALYRAQLLGTDVPMLRHGVWRQRDPGIFLDPPARDAPFEAMIEWAQKNEELRRKSTPMTLEELERAATTLFGPRWLEPMAKALQLPKRELEKIAKGKQPMPDWMRGAVAKVASGRIEAATSEAEKFAKWT